MNNIMADSYKKSLGLVDVTLATSGYVIGAGIYAILGIATKYGKQYTWISVLVSGIFSICTGLSFSELAGMYNKNAGEYYIAKDVFNKNTAVVLSLITVLTEILTQSIIARGMAAHLKSIIPIAPTLLSTLILICYGFINYRGIRSSVNYNNVATVLEVLGLLVVSFGGLRYFNLDVFNVSELNSKHIIPIILGSSIINFAYFGYDMAIELTEETINAEKNIPLGMMYGVSIALFLYLFVAISGLNTLGWKSLSKSETPVVDIANKLFGKGGLTVLFGIAIISMSNTLLMGNVASSRFIQAYAKDNDLLKPLRLDKLNPATNTPANAIILITILSVLFIYVIPEFEKLVNFSNLSILVIFIIMNIAVVILRMTNPEKKRAFTIPFSVNNIPMPSILAILLGTGSFLLVSREMLFNNLSIK